MLVLVFYSLRIIHKAIKRWVIEIVEDVKECLMIFGIRESRQNLRMPCFPVFFGDLWDSFFKKHTGIVISHLLRECAVFWWKGRRNWHEMLLLFQLVGSVSNDQVALPGNNKIKLKRCHPSGKSLSSKHPYSSVNREFPWMLLGWNWLVIG